MKYVSAREIETINEVIAQYEMTDDQLKEARASIDERARTAPFNAYHAAHNICAQITYVSEETSTPKM
jgi:hypothetical protein